MLRCAVLRLPLEPLSFQLREEFDRGVDVSLEEEHSVHDVAAWLKEFLRDMPDPLLTRELGGGGGLVMYL